MIISWSHTQYRSGLFYPQCKKKHNNKTNQRIPIALGFINVEVVGDVYYGMICVFSLLNFLFFYISFIDFRQGEGEKHQ